jgi:hypothetical protein
LSNALGIGNLFANILWSSKRGIMKPLNRPMFRMGGPIKEGIMDGIEEQEEHIKMVLLELAHTLNKIMTTL